jgi:ArsR family transcriptional regulator
MEMSESEAVGALGALAQAHRLAAFRLLVRAGASGVAAGDIARQLDLAPSTLSFHLSQLEQAGLVAFTRQGRSLIYVARFPIVVALMDYLTENCCDGAPCAVTSPRNEEKWP